ncbi:hypothetical protein [Myroides marinus]|uniref:hypothetical protein n=1 Tax=Myroides marinus TaxID=703342 RepID=UPI0025774363|nr:hypothetical protein [Myroides marinus]MDM1377348.1 hypothetical protein [Myroides marinus]
MKKLLFLLIVVFLFFGNILVQGQKKKIGDLSGIYILETDSKYQALSDDRNYSSLELHTNGTYTLGKAVVTFSPVMEQCDCASKGKWSVIADNVIEITSEDYYLKQKGYTYDIKKENKLSQDSLYIQVVFPTDFHPVKLDFTFNHNNNKSFTTDKTYIVLPKSKYLWNRRTVTNQISFSLNADISGTKLYKSRMLFEIFEESINTEKFNSLTISLPNFDRCFFEFEPYKQQLIYIKDKNQLLWQGETWRK